MAEGPENLNDLDFYIKFAKPLILALPLPKDRILASAWIKKLADEKSGDDDLRIQYVKLLLFMLQRRKLVGIFTDDPQIYETLQPFPKDFTIVDIAKNLLAEERREHIEKIRRKMHGEKGDQPPYSTDYSADLLEYVAAQDIPNFGVHLYYAFSKIPLPYWTNSEKGVFPKVPVAAAAATEMPSEAAGPGDSCACPVAQGAEGETKPKEGEAAAEPSGEGDVRVRDDGCRRQGAIPKKKRPRLGDEPPIKPLGVPPPAVQEEERPPPTWGSNLLQVREPPESIIQPTTFQSEASMVSEFIGDEAVSVIKEFKGEKGKSTPSKGAIPKRKKSPPKKTPSPKKPAFKFAPEVLQQMGLTEEDVAQMEFTEAELAELKGAAADSESDDSAEFRRQIEEMEKEDAIMYKEMEQREKMLTQMLAEAEADLDVDEKIFPESETVEQLQENIELNEQLAVLEMLEKELEEAKRADLPATTPKPAPSPKRPKSKASLADESKLPKKKPKKAIPKALPSKKKEKVVTKIFEEAAEAASNVDFYESKSALTLALEQAKAELAALGLPETTETTPLYTEARAPSPPRAAAQLPQELSPETMQFMAAEAQVRSPPRAPSPRPATPQQRTPPKRRSPDAITKAYNQYAELYSEGFPTRVPTPPRAPQVLSPETMQFEAAEKMAQAGATPDLTRECGTETCQLPSVPTEVVPPQLEPVAPVEPAPGPSAIQAEAGEMPMVTGGSPDANALARDARAFLNMPLDELFPGLNEKAASALFFDEEMPSFEEPPLSDSMEELQKIAQASEGAAAAPIEDDFFGSVMDEDEELPPMPDEELSPMPSPPRFGTPEFIDEFGLPRVEILPDDQTFKTPSRRQPAAIAPAADVIVEETRTHSVTRPPSPFRQDFTPPQRAPSAPRTPPSPFRQGFTPPPRGPPSPMTTPSPVRRTYTPPPPPALAGYVSPTIASPVFEPLKPPRQYAPPADVLAYEIPPDFLVESPATSASESEPSFIEDFESTVCGQDLPFLDETPPLLEDAEGEAYSPPIGDILQHYQIDEDFLDPDRPAMSSHVQVGRRRIPLERDAFAPDLSPIDENLEEMMGYESPVQYQPRAPIEVPAALRTPPPHLQRPPGAPGRGLLTKQEEIYLEYYAPPQDRRRLRMQAEAAAQARAAGLESDFALPPISPTNMYMQFPMWYEMPPLSPSPPPPREPTPPRPAPPPQAQPPAQAGPSGTARGRPGPSTGAVPKTKKKPFPMPRPRRPLVSKRIIPSKEPPPLPPPKGMKKALGKKPPPPCKGKGKAAPCKGAPPAKAAPPPRQATPPREATPPRPPSPTRRTPSPGEARALTPPPPREPSPVFAFDFEGAPDFGEQAPPDELWDIEDISPTSPEVFDLPGMVDIAEEMPPELFEDELVCQPCEGSPVPSEPSSPGPIDPDTGINVLRYLTEQHRKMPYWPTEMRYPRGRAARGVDLTAIHEDVTEISPHTAAMMADEEYQRRVRKARARNLPQPPVPMEQRLISAVSPLSSRERVERVRPGTRHRVTSTTKRRRLDFDIPEEPPTPLSPDRQPTMFDELLFDTLPESVAPALHPPIEVPGWKTPPIYKSGGEAAPAAAPIQIEGWQTPEQFRSPVQGALPVQPKRLFGTPTTEEQFMGQMREVNDLFKIMIGAGEDNVFDEDAGDIFQAVSPVTPATSPDFPASAGIGVTPLAEDQFEFPESPEGLAEDVCTVCPSPQPGPSWRRTPSPQPGPSWRRTPSPQPGPSWRRTPPPQLGPSQFKAPSPQPGPSWRRTPSPQPGPSWRRTPSPIQELQQTPSPPTPPSPPPFEGTPEPEYGLPSDLQRRLAQQMLDLDYTPPEMKTPPLFAGIQGQIPPTPRARDILIPETPTSPLGRPEARLDMYMGIMRAKKPKVRPMYLYGYGEIPAKPLARWSYMRSRLPPIKDEPEPMYLPRPPTGFNYYKPYTGPSTPKVKPVPLKLPKYKLGEPLDQYFDMEDIQVQPEEAPPIPMDWAQMPAELEAFLEEGLEEEAPELIQSPPCIPCTPEDPLQGYVPPPEYQSPPRAVSPPSAPPLAPLREHPIFQLPQEPDIFMTAPAEGLVYDEIPVDYESPPVSPVVNLPDLPPDSPDLSPVPDRLFAASVRQHKYTKRFGDSEHRMMTKRIGPQRRKLRGAQSPDLETVGEVSMEDHPPSPAIAEFIPTEMATVGPQYVPSAIEAAQRQMQALYDSPVQEQNPVLRQLMERYGDDIEEYMEQPHLMDVFHPESLRLPPGLMDPGISTFSPPRPVTPPPRQRTPSPQGAAALPRYDIFEDPNLQTFSPAFEEFPPQFIASPEAPGFGTLEEFSEFAGGIGDVGLLEDIQLEGYESPYSSPRQESAMEAAQRQLQSLYSPEEAQPAPCVPCGQSPENEDFDFGFSFRTPSPVVYGPMPTSRFLSPSPQGAAALAPQTMGPDGITPFQPKDQLYPPMQEPPPRRQSLQRSGKTDAVSVKLLPKTPLTQAQQRALEREERRQRIQALRYKKPVSVSGSSQTPGGSLHSMRGRVPTPMVQMQGATPSVQGPPPTRVRSAPGRRQAPATRTPGIRPPPQSRAPPQPRMESISERRPPPSTRTTPGMRPPPPPVRPATAGVRARQMTPTVSQTGMPPPTTSRQRMGAASAASDAIRRAIAARQPAATVQQPQPGPSQQSCAGPCSSTSAGPSTSTGAIRRTTASHRIPPQQAQTQVRPQPSCAGPCSSGTARGQPAQQVQSKKSKEKVRSKIDTGLRSSGSRSNMGYPPKPPGPGSCPGARR